MSKMTDHEMFVQMYGENGEYMCDSDLDYPTELPAPKHEYDIPSKKITGLHEVLDLLITATGFVGLCMFLFFIVYGL